MLSITEGLILRIPFAFNYGVCACLLISTVGLSARAQQRPDAGTTLQQTPRGALQAPPSSSDAQVVIPRAKRALSVTDEKAWAEKVLVNDVRISGNTIFDSQTLAAQLGDIKGKQIELGKLVDAIDAIRKYYVEAGYLLTDVYLPVQNLPQSGAILEIEVVEARIGKVNVKVGPDSGITQARAQNLVASGLRSGAAIRQYEIERVVYLLKDLPGVEASAVLTAGANVGEADVTIEVMSTGGKRVNTSVIADNMGARSTGQLRATALVDVNNPFGIGDQLSIRGQLTDRSGNGLFRVGYTLPVSGPTKLNLSLASTKYKLGAPFDLLGAEGRAEVASATIIHPLIRGRLNNLVGIAGLDYKSLRDDTTSIGQSVGQRVRTARLGLLGSATDAGSPEALLAGRGGNTIYSLVGTFGHATLNPATIIDLENTRGAFTKLNFDVQRVQFLSNAFSLLGNLSGQFSSKNLRGVERVSYGGPSGVRGYGVPSGTADEGLLATIELRYKLPTVVWGSPVTVSTFYDVATIRARRSPLAGATIPNTATFDSIGFGLRVGTEGKMTASMQIAQRIGGPYPIGPDGPSLESERRPQAWFTFQYWF